MQSSIETKHRKLAIAIASLAVLISADVARADYRATTSCFRGNCVETFRVLDGSSTGMARIINVPDFQTAESIERERRWVQRCRPAVLQDSYGVSRYYYVAAGCDVGRSSD